MINGIINVYKEKGYTSHDVVAKLRGILKQKKIGHTGTLDPDAEGVLPVCLGKATKLCDMLTDKDKTYVADLLLGMETDTQDTSGKVIARYPVTCNEKQVEEAIYSFLGTYEQIPPMYSALKVNGKKLYELAREGKVVERKPRTVKILDIQIIEMNLPFVKIKVSCSKGTYIRTLCHDIGQKLGCGGCMSSLLRTKVSSFVLDESVTLDEIAKAVSEQKVWNYITRIDEMFRTYESVSVKPEYSKLLYNGNAFYQEHCLKGDNVTGGVVRVYDFEDQFVGIYEWKEEEQGYFPVKIFWEIN